MPIPQERVYSRKKDREELLAVATKIGVDPKVVDKYLTSFSKSSVNELTIALISLKARELGMSYGQYVSLYEV